MPDTGCVLPSVQFRRLHYCSPIRGMPKARLRKHPEDRGANPMLGREKLLEYYFRNEDYILQRLRITEPRESLSDDDKAGLASAFLDLVTG